MFYLSRLLESLLLSKVSVTFSVQHCKVQLHMILALRFKSALKFFFRISPIFKMNLFKLNISFGHA